MSEAAQKPPQRQPRRVVSGMRPTGRLHLGHYHGAVKNWIEVSRKAECFFFSADWHALTSEYKDTSNIAQAQREMFADWIAAGSTRSAAPCSSRATSSSTRSSS